MRRLNGLAALEELECAHAHQHRGHEDERLDFAHPEGNEGRAGAEAGDAPTNAEERAAEDQAAVDVARRRQSHLGAEEGPRTTVGHREGDSAHGDGARHDEGEGRVPVTREVQEERIAFLTDLGIDRHLGDLNDVLVRRYARRMAGRPPSVSARLKEPARTLELSCFLRYCLLTATDQIIFMFQRRVADLWHHCADGVVFVDWSRQYQELLQELSELAGHDAVQDTELRSRLREIVAAKCAQRPPSRASVIRQRLIDAIAPVRSLLVGVSRLPWQATGEHPALDALNKLRAGYAAGIKRLPSEITAPRLGAA